MTATDNARHRFLIESCDVRGEVVQLGSTWLTAQSMAEYPVPVRQLLGEAFVATSLLAGTVKFAGKMTLQVRGPGPVHLLVVQITQAGQVRGMARWKAEPDATDLASCFGRDARMSITIESDRNRQPYQGIVELQGQSLVDALRSYFMNSEQLPTELHVSVGENSAAGLLLQRLPCDQRSAEVGTTVEADDDTENREDGWRRACLLAGTVTEEELLARDAPNLLHALFHEEQVRLFEPDVVEFVCSCNQQRTDNLLIGLGREEVESIVDEQGEVLVTCEFCNAHYHYDPIDAAALFRVTAVDEGEQRRH